MTDDSRFWKHTRVYAIATILGSLLHFAHVAWAAILTPEEYGRFANMQVLFNLASSPLTLAPQAFVLAFYHRWSRERLASALGSFFPVTFGLLALLLVAVAFAPVSALSVFGDNTAVWAVAVTLIGATLVGPKRMAAGIAEARGNAREASVWLEGADGMRAVIAFACFFLLGLRWEARLVGLVVAQGGAGVLAFVLLSRVGLIAKPSNKEAPLDETMAFVVPTMLSTMVYVGYDSADRLIVTHFHGLEAAGRYDLAYRIALIAQTVNVVFRRSFNPLFYEAHAAGRHEDARRLLSRTGRRLLLFTTPLAFLVPFAISWLPFFERGYEEAIYVIPVVAIGAAFWGIQVLWQQVLLADGRSGTVMWITAFGAVLNIALNLLLVPRFAEMGAAASTLACFVCMFLAMRVVGLKILSEGDPG